MDTTTSSPPGYPLKDINRVRWGVRVAIPFFILLYVPIDLYAFGMTWDQVLYLDLSIFGIGQVIFHVALQRFLQLQKQSRYPSLLAMELGAAQDLQEACDLSTRLVAEWLDARAAVLAWLDEEKRIVPVCSYGRPPLSLDGGVTAISPAAFGPTLASCQVVVLNAQELPEWAGLLDRRCWVAAVPLTALDRVTAVLFLIADRRSRDLRDRKLLESIGIVIGLSLENLRLTSREYQSIMQVLCSALDMRDSATEGHSQRVARMAALVARRMGMSRPEVRRIEQAAALHDIGKIGVSDAVLSKAGPLTDDEWVEMRRHPRLGFEIVADIEALQNAAEIIHCHHERYDGLGYPRGLKGEEILIGARIFAVADCYDAMTSHRPYRRARSHDDAIEEIARHSGTQFDPTVAQVFLDVARDGLIIPHDSPDARSPLDLEARPLAGRSWDRATPS
jgi:hypothetical protein